MKLRALGKQTIECEDIRQPWYLGVLLIAMAPALHTVATWDLDGRLLPQAFAVRHYSYFVVLIEVCVTWLAVNHRLSIKSTLAALPKSVSILLGIWFAFAVAALVSTSSDTANATFILARYTVHGLFLIALVHLVDSAKDFEMRKWLIVLSGGAVIYVLLLSVFCILVPDPKSFPWVLRVPSGTNIRQIGNNVGVLTIAPVALLLAKDRSSFLKPVAAFIIVFSFATWTGSRATIVGLAIGVTAGLIFVRNFSSGRNMLVGAVSVLAATVVSLVTPVPDPVLGMLRLVNASGGQADPSSGRWEMWAQTWLQILQSPWVGHGAGRYAKEMEPVYGTQWNHPHNFILQYFYDWGFFGGSAALILLAFLGFKILHIRDAQPVIRFTAITAFFALCSTAMIDGPLFHPLPIAVSLALIAPVLAKARTT